MRARDSRQPCRQHGMAAKLLYVWAAITTALVMADDVCSASVQQLPHTVLKALDELGELCSATAAKAGGRGVKELSREEDATILVQHHAEPQIAPRNQASGPTCGNGKNSVAASEEVGACAR